MGRRGAADPIMPSHFVGIEPPTLLHGDFGPHSDSWTPGDSGALVWIAPGDSGALVWIAPGDSGALVWIAPGDSGTPHFYMLVLVPIQV